MAKCPECGDPLDEDGECLNLDCTSLNDYLLEDEETSPDWDEDEIPEDLRSQLNPERDDDPDA